MSKIGKQLGSLVRTETYDFFDLESTYLWIRSINHDSDAIPLFWKILGIKPIKRRGAVTARKLSESGVQSGALED